MTTKITIILFILIMKSSASNIHNFVGSNLKFTMTTGKHIFLINVVHRLICLDMIATRDIYCNSWYFPRDKVKIFLLPDTGFNLVRGFLLFSKDWVFDNNIISKA